MPRRIKERKEKEVDGRQAVTSDPYLSPCFSWKIRGVHVRGKLESEVRMKWARNGGGGGAQTLHRANSHVADGAERKKPPPRKERGSCCLLASCRPGSYIKEG